MDVRLLTLPLAIVAASFAGASLVEAQPKAVNAVTFVRAESDRYMSDIVREVGLGVLAHRRTTTPLDQQTIIRMNLDTLYSSGVYDLSAGSLTISLPEVDDGRYVALQLVSQDHLTPMVLHEGVHTVTEEMVGTRYVALLGRVFVDPNDPADPARAHAVQDAIKVEQAAAGAYETPDWDRASLDAARKALLDLGALGRDGFGPMMGAKGEVDPISHLVATAVGWGLNPPDEAVYLFVTPPANDGATVHTLALKDVPVDGFWSISVYDKDGYFAANEFGRNALNNVTGAREPDGAYAVQFGGCSVSGPENCIPITEGWNYVVRLYRPRADILKGSWALPDAKPKD